MKSVRLIQFGLPQLVLSVGRGVKRAAFGAVSFVQHLVMKIAIALSLKLCLFTARVLMNSNTPASESF